jgi:formylglycine-generating enzyme required for sulfatase activity
MPIGERRRLAIEVASAADVRWTERFVGEVGLPEFELRGVLFVLVPGGRYTMGFHGDEMRQLLRAARLGPGTPGADHWRPIFEAGYERARPLRDVEIGAFLCARAPLVDRDVARVDETLVIREPFGEARNATDAVPAFVRAKDASRLARDFGARMLSEAEWEYVAREGGASHATKAYADWHRGTEDLHAHPAFAPIAVRGGAEEDEDDLAREEEERLVEEHTGEGFHALGVWGLDFGEWVADAWHETYAGAPAGATSWGAPAEPEMHRGGGVLHYPWQDSPEVLSAHPAHRARGGPYGGLGAVRLALSLA